MSESPENKFDFSVPAPVPPAGAPRPASRLTWLTVMAVGAVLWATQWITTRRLEDALQRPEPAPPAGQLPLDKQKQLALQLEARNVHREAAEAWLHYLHRARLEPQEQARLYYHVGTLYQKADAPGPAIACFFTSEALHKADGSELEQQIRDRLGECFERLGLHDEWQYELAGRVALDKPGTDAARQVVAEIGAEKISLADVDAMIRREVDMQMKMMGGLLSPDLEAKVRQQHLARFEDPRAKQEMLHRLLQERVLHREAREQALDKDRDVADRIRYLARQVLIAALVEKETQAKLQLTDHDFALYYHAKKEQYRESAKVRIRQIVVPEEAQAGRLLAEVKAGAALAELAAKHSIDAKSKASGGAVEAWIHEQSSDDAPPVEGITGNAEFVQAVTGAAKGAVIDRPLKSALGWHVVQVVEKEPARQKPYEEVRDQVVRAAMQEKLQEIQQALVARLFQKYRVRLVGQGLGAGPATQDKR